MTDVVDAARSLGAEARDLEREKSDLEARLREVNRRLSAIYFSELPRALTDAGLDSVGIPARGNLPAVDVRLAPEVRASISNEWPEDRRAAAFRWLQENGHGDLIKTEVVARFPREMRASALEFADRASGGEPGVRADGATVLVRETVNAQTLTAWLRRLLDEGRPCPPLEIIGGEIVPRARVEHRKE